MRQFHRIIVEQADHMRGIITDLLDVARIQTGTLSITCIPCEVAALVEDARNTFVRTGGRDNLEIDLAPDLPLVMVDPRRISQVLRNLFTNAASHSPAMSRIRIEAELDEPKVAISVTDEGQGFTSDQLPHLFRKYGAATQGRDAASSDLGLAICRGIVESHGGRIWAHSDGPGLGATFTFTVPSVDETATPRTPLAPVTR